MQEIRLLRPINLVLIAIIQGVVQYGVIARYAVEPETIFTPFQFALMVLITLAAEDVIALKVLRRSTKSQIPTVFYTH